MPDVVDGPDKPDEQATNNSCVDQDCSSGDLYVTPGELPVQASAKALYSFKAEPAGSISMEEGELFDVIEYDQGDGWTRVRRKTYEAEAEDFIGFVPTSYISIEVPDNQV